METFQVLHSRIGFWPYPQTLDRAGNACQGQTLSLLWKVVNYVRKKFYEIDFQVVAIDGSVFRYHPHFPNIMKSRIQQLMGVDYKFDLVKILSNFFVPTDSPLS